LSTEHVITVSINYISSSAVWLWRRSI